VKLLVTGGSGSGTTTLGRALGEALGLRALDADDYFWQPTDPPYQQKRSGDQRNAMLLADLVDGTVLSGSVVRWDAGIEDEFDLIVHLSAPTDVRLERLRRRELAESGRIDEDFLACAAAFDTAGLDMRSAALHEAWFAARWCPILRLDGTRPVRENVGRIERALAR